MAKILIDARLWGTHDTGPGRYTENLIANLPDQKHSVEIITSRSNFKNPQLAKFSRKYPAKFHPYSLLSQFEMLLILLKSRPDLLHSTHFTVPVLWPGKATRN